MSGFGFSLVFFSGVYNYYFIFSVIKNFIHSSLLVEMSSSSSSSSSPSPSPNNYSEDDLRRDMTFVRQKLTEMGIPVHEKMPIVNIQRRDVILCFSTYKEIDIIPPQLMARDSSDALMPTGETVRVAYNLTTAKGRVLFAREILRAPEDHIRSNEMPYLWEMIRRTKAAYVVQFKYLRRWIGQCLVNNLAKNTALSYGCSHGEAALDGRGNVVKLAKLTPVLPTPNHNNNSSSSEPEPDPEQDINKLADKLEMLSTTKEFRLKDVNLLQVKPPQLTGNASLLQDWSEDQAPQLRNWFVWRNPTNQRSIMYPNHYLCWEARAAIMTQRSHGRYRPIDVKSLARDPEIPWCSAMCRLSGQDKAPTAVQNMQRRRDRQGHTLGIDYDTGHFVDPRIPQLIYYDLDPLDRSEVFYESVEVANNHAFHYYVPDIENTVMPDYDTNSDCMIDPADDDDDDGDAPVGEQETSAADSKGKNEATADMTVQELEAAVVKLGLLDQ